MCMKGPSANYDYECDKSNEDFQCLGTRAEAITIFLINPVIIE